MTTSIVDAESVLAIDIGSVHTRALLFDVVDSQYRFIASSRVNSTAAAPFFDISEGIYQSIVRLQEVSARTFLEDSRLVIPARPDGIGIDQVVMTFSAGQSMRVVLMGLLEDVSLESARRLAGTTQALIAEAIGLNDRRRPDMQMDAILQAKPDLVIISGGTESGATRSVAKQVDLLTLAMQIMAREKRPEVIYAGNQAMAKYVKESLTKYVDVRVAPNVRPAVDFEVLDPALNTLGAAVREIRTRQLGGLQSYASICSVEPLPTPQAFGRMVRFLSKINNPKKGVLGVDLGASSTTLAAAREGRLDLSVFPIGTGSGLERALERLSVEEIARWLPMHLPAGAVREYLYQKTLFPGSIPSTTETLSIEQASVRHLISLALRAHFVTYPQDAVGAYEPILASGLALTQATPAQSLMMLLDSIQPLGVTTFALDPYGLTPALGAVAPANSLLAAQVIHSNAYVNLGTVISPLCNARYGTTIMRVRVEYSSGEDATVEVRQGTLTPLPIQHGQVARVHLQPLRSMQIDPNRKDSTRSFKVTGGSCGAVIDTRGRPLVLPKDDSRRRDMLKKWLAALNI